MIAPYSEDLYEEEYYTEKPWREVTDRDLLSITLHIFKPSEDPHQIQPDPDAEGPNYLKSVDGNIEQGQWGRLKKHGSNMLTCRVGEQYELFEKAFINEDFFILKKHGDSKPKYFVMGREAHVKKLEWREVVELLYNIYTNRIQFFALIIIVAIFLFIVAIFSFY